MAEIDTEMYLRDGAPHATVCKVTMKDGRLGIGVHRWTGAEAPEDQEQADAKALADALNHLFDRPLAQQESDDDLQASLGHKAHG